MNKSAIAATMFDAACFLLANLNLISEGVVSIGELDLKDFRAALRCVVSSSAMARAELTEKELGLDVEHHV